MRFASLFVIMSKSSRKENKMKIIKNAVKCTLCDTYIVSSAPQGYVECACGNVGVSGGTEELIRHCDKEDYIEKSVIEITGKRV